MQFVVWVLAACLLLGVAAFLASVIDRRAGWSKIPLEVDGSENPDEYEIGAPIVRRFSRRTGPSMTPVPA